jgi:putative ABC transport system permease protein
VIKLALKSLWARRTRAFTTTLAVFIGVALVAGTYVLTDTINAAFDDIFESSLEGTDVVITAKEEVRQESGVTPTFDASALEAVKRVDGVRVAAGGIFSVGGIFDQENDRIGSQFAPKFISSTAPPALDPQTYPEGDPPRSPDEAAIDQAAADQAGLEVGDTIRVAGERKAKRYELVGITRLGDASFGGAVVATLTLPEAQIVTGNVGRFDQISVAADEGVSAPMLQRRIAAAVPDNLRVETAQENANRESDEIRDDLGFFRVALLVFAGVALFVGAFLIFNTFSITVAQRVREFGMLRTLGASRRQILGSVILESLLIGAVGAVAGILGGLAFAKGINALFEAIGVDLPSTAQVVATRTIVVSLLIGILITLVSSLAPAVRSTRIPPMAALSEIEPVRSRRRTALYSALAVLVIAAGLAMLLAGLFGDIESSGSAAALMGGGAVLVLLGVAIFSPRLVKPLASLGGAPIQRLRGLTGRLARENTQRKPGRTAATSAALMIGLALVTFVAVFAAGFKGSISAAVDRNFQGELVIQNTDGFSPIPAAAARAARQVPGVDVVSSLRFIQAEDIGAGSGKPRISALDPRTANDVLSLDWEEGGPDTLSSLTDRGIIVDKGYADANGVEVGDRLRFLTQIGRRPAFEVAGIVKDNADLIGSGIVTQAAMAREFGTRDDTYDYVRLDPGADAAAVQDRLSAIAERDFPTTEVLNQEEVKEKSEEQINQLLGLVYALLSLAVIVSLFGIANTLALSIHERTRELGMLRAIGMSRRQVRQMVRYEAVITSLIGAVLGLVLGVIFAALVSRPLEDEGFTLTYPIATLVVLVVLAGLAGVVAAIGPARRASRLNVLEALAYE